MVSRTHAWVRDERGPTLERRPATVGPGERSGGAHARTGPAAARLTPQQPVTHASGWQVTQRLGPARPREVLKGALNLPVAR